MKANEYQIRTIQDIVDCTNETNLDNFLIDLKNMLSSAHTLRSLSELVSEIKNLTKKERQIEVKEFTWIDDSKHEIKTTIRAKKLK
jgi:hypothetical protein